MKIKKEAPHPKQYTEPFCSLKVLVASSGSVKKNEVDFIFSMRMYTCILCIYYIEQLIVSSRMLDKSTMQCRPFIPHF